MPGRQVRLVWGSSYLDLNGSTYILQADNGWQSAGGQLAVRVLVQASTMAEMERKIVAVRQVVTRAALYQERMAGDPVEVWTKTCDDLEDVAELGATWMTKQIRAGRVDVQHTCWTWTICGSGRCLRACWRRPRARPMCPAPAGAGSQPRTH